MTPRTFTTMRCVALFVIFSTCISSIQPASEKDFNFEDINNLNLKSLDTLTDDEDMLADEAGSTPDDYTPEAATDNWAWAEPRTPLNAAEPDAGRPTGDDGDGSGDVDVPPMFPTFQPGDSTNYPEYYRSNVNITNEHYDEPLGDRSTREFRTLSRDVGIAIRSLYADVPGQQEVTVLQFRPALNHGPRNRRALLTTFDLGTIDFYDKLDLFNTLNTAVNSGNIRQYETSPVGFTFTPLEGPEEIPGTSCDRTQFMCRDMSCIHGDLRCDGNTDCPDSSDELNCVPLGCQSDEFDCGNMNCIPESQRCDGMPNCPNREDEENCPGCTDTEFRCGDGTCISDLFLCDGRGDCLDGSDENDCPCQFYEFRCITSMECVSKELMCNGESDCLDNSDENNCNGTIPEAPCRPDQFKCHRGGGCAEPYELCDSHRDCRDGSDEVNCIDTAKPLSDYPMEPDCAETEFSCGDGECMSNDRLCDGSRDCLDGRDEENCGNPSVCRIDEYHCNNDQCIPLTQKCDGQSQCADGSDETGCSSTECSEGEFQCASGSCINAEYRCDALDDCSDGSDELNCGTSSNCDGDNQYDCGTGECIPVSQLCDGFTDCMGSVDELNCEAPDLCRSDQFECATGQCIHESLHCNGHWDCVDGSDEKQCEPERCHAGQFQCEEGQCISRSQYCDGNYDCPDQSDEVNCPVTPAPCSSTQYTCNNGDCIAQQYYCDGTRDCEDNSDENNCPVSTTAPCRENQFECDNGQCIPQPYYCDGTPDCNDQSDENDCAITPAPCSSSQYQCDNGQCIPQSYYCDGRPDCSDQSDEQNCPVTPVQCDTSQYQCNNGDCIPQAYYCDGQPDCSDQSDEQNCPVTPAQCDSSQYQCNNGDCIPQAYYCDGQPDCSDQSDEQNCPVTPAQCDSSQYQCNNGDCISQTYYCDGRFDCSDQSDEQNCPVTLAPCTNSQYRCNNGQCIPQAYYCDGRPDCSDQSDEQNCPVTATPCTNSEFQCNNGRCIPQSYYCDGRPDCSDQSDEQNCVAPVPTCDDATQFQCSDGQCIYSSQKCDGHYNCNDRSDEVNCPPTQVVLMVHPKTLTAREFQDVSFQCRATGSPSPTVRWTRRGQELSAHTTVTNGLLSIPRVKLTDAGEYACAVSGPTGHQEVIVTLTVQSMDPPGHGGSGVCADGEAACTNGQCIPRDFLCDGDYDCTDRSDEINCSILGMCEPNEFQCSNGKCIQKNWVCDGDSDCSDGDDERNCKPSRPGDDCLTYEFSCESRNQCIPASYQCDGELDCMDQSDENGCVKPTVIQPPPASREVQQGETVVIACEAIGTPVPLIIWRLNWGHVGDAPRVFSTTEQGRGTLTIKDARAEDEGAYTCEALNSKGTIFAQPDTILVVHPPTGLCRSPQYNADARHPSDCLTCFCFDLTDRCTSSTLYKTQVLMSGSISLVDLQNQQPLAQDIIIQPPGQNVYSIHDYTSSLQDEEYYWMLPRQFLGNRIGSYGDELIYNVYYTSRGSPYITGNPDVYISGNGLTIQHTQFTDSFSGITETAIVRIIESEWSVIQSGRPQPATRAQLMTVLQNVDSILIKSKYDDYMDEVRMSNIRLGITSTTDMNLGRAVLVEDCSCPPGYTGTSCEECALGYVRTDSHDGQLGRCIACDCNGHSAQCDQNTNQCLSCTGYTTGSRCESCLPGYYRRNPGNLHERCEPCACPLTNPENQFASQCSVDHTNQLICHGCQEGYTGRTCDRCADGYSGNPTTPGGRCTFMEDDRSCDPRGSISTQPDPFTQRCQCKANSDGRSCSTCRQGSYHLSVDNPDGCITCFCMGVTTDCTSTTQRRDQLSLDLRYDTGGLSMTDREQSDTYDQYVTADRANMQATFRNPGNLGQTEFYWVLPQVFIGNQLKSYGGYLQFTTSPQVSYNNNPLVEIAGNDIILQYSPRDTGISVVRVPILEQHWRRPDGALATREALLMCLAGLDYVHIRTSGDSFRPSDSSISKITLDTAIDQHTNTEVAYPVEQCRCPPGYTGLSCETCSPGYRRTGGGLYLGTCEPDNMVSCDCNGHSQCDQYGRCMECRDYTTGSQCERCLDGYYGDATQGTTNSCQPCPCPLTQQPNQFSSTCHLARDGQVTCDQCAEGHTGRRCESCLSEYSGNPSQPGDYCRRSADPGFCSCDPDGTEPHSQCDAQSGQCHCRPHVIGTDCSRCESGHFGFGSTNGCIPCWCNEMDSQCRESNYYRHQISPSLSSGQHGITLTSRRLDQQITDGIQTNLAADSVFYDRFSQQSEQTLYWNLPEEFTGNQVLSYGGWLEGALTYTTLQDGRDFRDVDIEIVSGNYRLYHLFNPPLSPNGPNDIRVHLVESSFQMSDSTSPSHATFMSILSNIDHILVRSSYHSSMRSSELSRLRLDTAVEYMTGQAGATEVEMCACPTGYTGTSCESCSDGYTKDASGRCVMSTTSCDCNGHSTTCDPRTGLCQNCQDYTTGDHCEVCRSGFYGSPTQNGGRCEPCPCPDTRPPYQFSTTCYMELDGRATCDRCTQGTTGRNCESCVPGYVRDPRTNMCQQQQAGTAPEVVVLSRRVFSPTGRDVTFHVEVDGSGPLDTVWRRVDGQPLAVGHRVDPRTHSLTLPTVQVEDAGVYIITISNRYGQDTGEGQLDVQLDKTIDVTIAEPRVITAAVGETIRFECLTNSQVRNTLYTVAWSRTGTKLPLNARDTGDGTLIVSNVRLSDAGTYTCTGSNLYNIDYDSAVLKVQGTAPPPTFTVQLSDTHKSVTQGQPVRLSCSADSNLPIRSVVWTKMQGQLPFGSTQSNGVLTIPSMRSDFSGQYVCTITLDSGASQRAMCLLNIADNTHAQPPTAVIEPEMRTVGTGQTASMTCEVTGSPAPHVTWSRGHGDLPSSHQIVGNTLRIPQAQVEDRGVYVCLAENSAGQAMTSAILEVERRVLPALELYPGETQTVSHGSSALFQCRVTAGMPSPTITWTRANNEAMTPNTEITIDNGVIQFNQITGAEQGTYICTATNSMGSVTLSAALLIQGPPSITLSPSSPVTARVGQSLSLECIAHGSPTPNVSWRPPVSLQQEFPASALGPQQPGSATLTINSVTAEHAGHYVCVADNGVERSQEYMEVTVSGTNTGLPDVLISPMTLTSNEGETVQFTCTVPGSNPQWSRRQGSLPVQHTVYGGVLQIDSVRQEDSGYYICTATNHYGVGEQQAYLMVEASQNQPVVHIENRDISGAVGSTVELRCTFAGTPAPTVQWVKEQGMLPAQHQIHQGTLIIYNVQPHDSGRYICIATNNYGSAQEHCNLNIQGDVSEIETQTQVVTQGDTVEMNCRVTGNPIVEWERVDGELPQNARVTGTLLTIYQVQPQDMGIYRCRASDRGQTVYVQVALEIQSPPVFRVSHQTRVATIGSRVQLTCIVDGTPIPVITWSKQDGQLPVEHEVQGARLTINNIRREDYGEYICTARNQYGQQTAIMELLYGDLVPLFLQDPISYMSYSAIPNAYHQYDLEISVHPQSTDGLILYNGQMQYTNDPASQSGDFVSLGMRDGRVEYRFDMGSGPTTITSGPVDLDVWHDITFSRNKKDGVLTVDGVEYTGSSTGSFLGLDLADNMYLGSVPDYNVISPAAGFNTGFIGGISRLLVNGLPVNLGSDALETHGIQAFPVCQGRPCQHGGTCKPAYTSQGFLCTCARGYSGRLCELIGEQCYNGACGEGECYNHEDGDGYRCACPMNRGGDSCQQAITIDDPMFNQTSFIAYNTIPNALHELQLSLTFKPTNLDDSILLYNSQTETGGGDFIALLIRDGHVELRYDSGSGVAILQSSEPLPVNQWTTVVAERNERDGSLSLNGGVAVKGVSPGDTIGLNLGGDLYIGGVEHDMMLPSAVGVETGFKGCATELLIRGTSIDLVRDAVRSESITNCASHPACALRPCQNNGQCRQTPHNREGYMCICPPNWTGTNCETEMSICITNNPCQRGECEVVRDQYVCNCPLGYTGRTCDVDAPVSTSARLSGNGYIELDAELFPHGKQEQQEETIMLTIRTDQSDGLILWHGQEAHTPGHSMDYIMLALEDGHLIYSYELGSGAAIMRSTQRLDNGGLHHIVATRNGRYGSIMIDNGGLVEGESGGMLQELNTRGSIYIGGVPDTQLMTGDRYPHGFNGQISQISFNRGTVVYLGHAISGVNVQAT